MEELKPCPWCKEEVNVSRSHYPSMITISCENVDGCLVMPSYSVDAHGDLETTEKAMIEAWNTRKEKE